MSWEAIAVVVAAFITTAGTVIAAVVGVRTRRDLRTNHGKKPWEYLELVADVHSDVQDLKAELVAHTAQDAKNFEKMEKGQRQLWKALIEAQEISE